MNRRPTLRAGFSLIFPSALTPQGPLAESQHATAPTPSRQPTWEDLLGRR